MHRLYAYWLSYTNIFSFLCHMITTIPGSEWSYFATTTSFCQTTTVTTLHVNLSLLWPFLATTPYTNLKLRFQTFSGCITSLIVDKKFPNMIWSLSACYMCKKEPNTIATIFWLCQSEMTCYGSSRNLSSITIKFCDCFLSSSCVAVQFASLFFGTIIWWKSWTKW